jgi:hypothetical protein
MNTALAWVRGDKSAPAKLFFDVIDLGPRPEIPASAIQECFSILRKQLFVGPGVDRVLGVRLHRSSIAGDDIDYPMAQ